MSRAVWGRISRLEPKIRDVLTIITVGLLLLVGVEILRQQHDIGLTQQAQRAQTLQLTRQQDRLNLERRQRRAQLDQAICAIVNAIPPGNPRIDSVRHRFGCGHYIPPGIPGTTRIKRVPVFITPNPAPAVPSPSPAPVAPPPTTAAPSSRSSAPRPGRSHARPPRRGHPRPHSPGPTPSPTPSAPRSPIPAPSAPALCLLGLCLPGL